MYEYDSSTTGLWGSYSDALSHICLSYLTRRLQSSVRHDAVQLLAGSGSSTLKPKQGATLSLPEAPRSDPESEMTALLLADASEYPVLLSDPEGRNRTAKQSRQGSECPLIHPRLRLMPCLNNFYQQPCIMRDFHISLTVKDKTEDYLSCRCPVCGRREHKQGLQSEGMLACVQLDETRTMRVLKQTPSTGSDIRARFYEQVFSFRAFESLHCSGSRQPARDGSEAQPRPGASSARIYIRRASSPIDWD